VSASRGDPMIRRVLGTMSMVLGLGGAIFWLVGVHQANYAAMNPFGLVSVMTWPFYVAITMAITPAATAAAQACVWNARRVGAFFV